MHWILVFSVVVIAGITYTTAKPSQLPQICREIRRNGCSAQLKQTGQVCGSDGRTYRNACILEKKACKRSSDLNIVYYGQCKQQTEQPHNQAGGTGGEETVFGVGGDQNEAGDTIDGADQNELGDTPDGADQNLPDDTDLPDTTDAPDAPGVQDPGAQAGPEGPDVTESPEPPESPDAPPAPGSSSSGSSEEQGTGGGGAGGPGAPVGPGTTMGPLATSQPPLSPGAKVCPDKCPAPLKQDMVCASNSETYLSNCLLQQYACMTNESLSIVHRGPCNNTCGPDCPLVYEPVCGMDNLTYMSRCDLLRTACLTQDETLQVAYNQECAGVAALKGCPECDPIPEPLCTNSNMTFRSQCEFDRFVCIFDVKGIEVAYNDSCPGAPLVCPNYCEKIDDPVCATDGLTYPNICEIGVADCHAKTIDQMAEVGFESYGPCPEGTPDPCSPDSPTCEQNDEPVCAIKGKEQISYFNRCLMQKAICVDPTIKYVSEGRCALPAPK